MTSSLDPHERTAALYISMSCIGATVGTLPATLYTGLYTGLYMARIRYLAEQDMRELLAQDFPECHPARGQVTVI